MQELKAVRKHIVNHIGNIKLNMLNRGHIQKMYDKEFEKSQDVTETIRTVINSSMNYARKKKLISSEPGKNVRLPKKAKKQAYRTRKIDVKRTLNLEQIKILIEASKKNTNPFTSFICSFNGIKTRRNKWIKIYRY